MLPPADTVEAWDVAPQGEAPYLGAVLTICERHGLGGVAMSRFASGSLPVFAVGQGAVVKLYPPVFAEEQSTEAAVLERLRGRLATPTPSILASGELQGWRYLVMSRLSGRSLREVWDDVASTDRSQLASALGRDLRTLHSLDTAGLTVHTPAFEPFLAGQRAGCVARQRRLGLDEAWLAQIPAFLASVDLGSPAAVLLHTEIMREHVFAAPSPDGWSLSGLIDFEPAMLGPPEYEFSSVATYFAEGDASVMASVLDGYGVEPQDPAFRRRCLAYTLLHRFSHMRRYLERLRPEATSLYALAEEWWGRG